MTGKKLKYTTKSQNTKCLCSKHLLIQKPTSLSSDLPPRAPRPLPRPLPRPRPRPRPPAPKPPRKPPLPPASSAICYTTRKQQRRLVIYPPKYGHAYRNSVLRDTSIAAIFIQANYKYFHLYSNSLLNRSGILI